MPGPSVKTVKRLCLVSGNQCAFPKCGEPMVLGTSIVGEICHIKAANPDGPRHDPIQNEEERHGFDNLLLLCRPHHKIIDDDPIAYTVDRLTLMKHTHEASVGEMKEAEAATAATLLVGVNQSGGLMAGQVHAHTINIHTADRHPDMAALRAYFVPELARITARQIWAMGRIVPNYSITSHGKPHLPGDTWISLLPSEPDLYPTAPEFQRLAPEDGTLLVEFYDSLRGVAEVINDLVGVHPLDDYNAWNIVLHKTTRNLELAKAAIIRFCPGREYDPAIPAAGTLLSQVERVLAQVAQARAAFWERHKAAQAANPPIPPNPRMRRRRQF